MALMTSKPRSSPRPPKINATLPLRCLSSWFNQLTSSGSTLLSWRATIFLATAFFQTQRAGCFVDGLQHLDLFTGDGAALFELSGGNKHARFERTHALVV